MSISSLLAVGRMKLSHRSTANYAAVVAVSFSAASSAPTPLYRVYQDIFDLSPPAVTMIFAIYVLGMVAAFLTFGRLSDHVGRRPMILGALVLNVVALGLFVLASQASHLALARLLQGIATGVALTTLGATVVDANPKHGATLNSVTAFIGLTLGSLLAGSLIAWAPLPTKLVYAILLAVSLFEIVVLAIVPETTGGKPGGFAALVPRIGIPALARSAMARLMPLNLAAWALGGFYFSLMPALVSAATGVRSPLLGAAVVAALSTSATASVLFLRGLAPDRLLRLASAMLSVGIGLTLLAVMAHSGPAMIFGTLVAGIGFGSAYFGSLRTLIPLSGDRERAGLLAAYLVISYIAFAVPAIVAGLIAPHLGLVTTAYVYGAVLMVMTGTSLVLLSLSPRRPAPQVCRG
jgi:MFS family permease